MAPRHFAPLPLAAAMLFMAAPITGVQAAGTQHRTQPAAATATAPATRGVLRQVAFKTGMAGGKMVFMDEKGTVNPVLKANVGDTVEMTLASGEGAEHDLVIDELGVRSAKFNGKSGAVKVTFKLKQSGKFSYYCSIAGHRQIGMEGMLEVAGPADATAATTIPSPALKTVAAKPAAATPAPVAAAAQALPPAMANAVSIAMDPNAVPKPLGTRPPQLVKYSIETVELEGKLDDGTTFTYWTFDKKVPGPMLRVKVDDTVELKLSNAKNSTQVHSIDLHAVNGGMGGGQHTQVAPGETKTVTFKALNPGLYVYHCATPSVPHHISAGMYGLILVEPAKGLPAVDKEFYVMQGDLYTSHRAGTKGHQAFSHERASDELPTYYTFNGAVGALTKEYKMSAKTGETVRVYFGVGGPNKVSSFHVIGEVFDRVWSEGATNTVKENVQTTLVAPGGATMVEFKVQVPGTYLLVDHALSRVGKGLVAALEVTGPDADAVYKFSDKNDASMSH